MFERQKRCREVIKGARNEMRGFFEGSWWSRYCWTDIMNFTDGWTSECWNVGVLLFSSNTFLQKEIKSWELTVKNLSYPKINSLCKRTAMVEQFLDWHFLLGVVYIKFEIKLGATWSQIDLERGGEKDLSKKNRNLFILSPRLMFIESVDWHEWQPSRDDEFAYLKMERDSLFSILNSNLRNFGKIGLWRRKGASLCFHTLPGLCSVWEDVCLLAILPSKQWKDIKTRSHARDFASADPNFRNSPVSHLAKKKKTWPRRKWDERTVAIFESKNCMRWQHIAQNFQASLFLFLLQEQWREKSLIRLASHAHWVLIL